MIWKLDLIFLFICKPVALNMLSLNQVESTLLQNSLEMQILRPQIRPELKTVF